MGNEYELHVYFCINIYNEIENSFTNNKSDSYIKEILTNQPIFISDKFICWRFSVNDDIWIKCIITLCEYKEKFLFLKCLFPLLEELKRLKFENQLSKVIQLQKNQKHKDDILLKYYDEHKDEIEKLTNNQQIIEKCNNSINSLQESPFINIYKEILECSIEIIMEFQEFKKIKDFDKKDKFCDIIEKFLITVSQEKNGSNQLIELLDFFSKIESLNHTADLYELFIFLLHKKISIRYYIFENKNDKNLDKELKYLIYNIKLDEN